MSKFGIDAGKVAEYYMAARCLEYGFMVAWPSALSPYDILVDNEEATVRVQVKATFSREANRDCYKINCVKGNDSPYTEDDCDFVACYLRDIHLFYIIPIREVSGKKTIRFYPDKSGTGQYEQFKERFDLLKGFR